MELLDIYNEQRERTGRTVVRNGEVFEGERLLVVHVCVLNSRNEMLIQQRQIGGDQVLEFEVSGDEPRAVHMLPGYTHNIINLSDTRELVTLMWANELFDPQRPDTFFEPV